MTLQLSAHNITVKIGTKIICKNFNINIQCGEVWGLLGPNGCGKTTFLHALCGIHPLSIGEVLLDGKNIKSLPIKTVAQLIGILFQDVDPIFSQTVFEYCLASRYPHLMYFKRENSMDIAIVNDALEQMTIAHLQREPITALSGGERRRLAIASILAQTPQIYLLDEPTNHLDLQHQIKVLQHFRKLEDCAVMMSLHDVNWAHQFCDHIMLLFANGEIVIGTPNEVLTAETLTRLYQHPIRKIISDRNVFWYPKMPRLKTCRGDNLKDL